MLVIRKKWIMAEENRTELKDLGEFGLINHLNSSVKLKQSSTIKGIGDDAAVIDINEKEYGLLSTDFLVEGIHFDLTYTPLKHLGYKAIAVNVSDIAAMNGIATQVTVSIAISNRFSLEAIEELYKGIELACEAYNVDLIGGDTTSSLKGLVISVCAYGTVDKDKVVYRNTAQKGDIICVTGDFGAAYMGLQLLEREKAEFLANPDMQPKLQEHDYLVMRLLKPEARLDMIHTFKEVGLVPTSMMDVSDGLASELFHIAKQSDVGIRIYDEKLPKDDMTSQVAMEFNIDPYACMLHGGEDYELLFTIKEADFDKIKNLPDVHTIGIVEDKSEGVNLYTKAGNVHELSAQGWTHF